ncbi:ribonuclease 3-like protein 2 [Magnolia sinica]|uniref:ribonuclease 3-like protein 2 n=1 Tax=Magnolia sinica TaxID=86752 RepID=UPI002657C21C|nr:ribonuclease 3-like protein 2 [Magnolia sinica]
MKSKSKSKRSKKSEEEEIDEEDYGIIVVHTDTPLLVDMDMRTAIPALEHLLGYNFHDQSLLIEALTHSSYTEAESYQRLEFVGDAVLGLALTNHIFLTYPTLDPGQLSSLRAANISTEKLARVAVRHNLYSYLRRNAPALDEKVREFSLAIRYDADEVPYDGTVKAPKVLADIVESIAAAVYVDCNFDLKVLWLVFRALLEPIVTLDTLQQQPVTMLFEYCQKHGRRVDIRHWKKGVKNIANVYVDGKMVGSGCSEQKEIAKLNAAKEALQKLLDSEPMSMDTDSQRFGGTQEEGAKQRLNELCSKNRWPKPFYKVEKEVGPAHEKLFMCSVQIGISNDIYVSSGDLKSRVKDAENSAASCLLNALLELNFA